MDKLFKIFLVIHIISGAIGLISGTMNIIRKKGDKNHKLVGKMFLYSMLSVALTSLILSSLKTNHFLFIVGVFTFYMVLTANRYLSLKEIGLTQKPKIIDWLMTITMLLFGIVFLVFGIYNLTKGKNFGIVFIVFGSLGLRMVSKDIKYFKGKMKIKNYWLIAHLQRMVGAYIAALTAFLVVNGRHVGEILPSFLVWLLPTIILFPVIIMWTRKYKIIKKENH